MSRLFRIALACGVASLGLLTTSLAATPLPDFTSIVKREGGSVVNISTTQKPRARTPVFPGIDEDDPVYELFRRFMPRFPDESRPGGDGNSLGSGFVIDTDGYILTNAHVIEDADEVLVRLMDKREFVAEVVGRDRRSDVALLRIDARDLRPVTLGAPDRLEVGEWVLAIGSPFGFDHSVTAGIVSAKGRSLPDENFVPFIQTDVAINPGNSGGPLFNLRGEVVGMNSQIYSQTGGFMGLSFAIPIDVAMEVQSQLRNHGTVRRGRIGVEIQEVTRAIADSFGLVEAEGALVSGVEPGAPAALAGVGVGDVIVRFAGKRVASSGDLPRIVAASRPGEEVELVVVRNARETSLKVTVGEWREEHATESRGQTLPARGEPNKLGLVVREPSAEQTRRSGVSGGLVVEQVTGSVELRRGDMLLAIVIRGQQIALDSVAVFEAEVGGLQDGETVSLLVRRGGGTMFVTARAGG